MNYRSLGRTGMQVSTWSLGSMLFGGVIVPYYLDDGFADFRPYRYHW